MLAQRPKPLEYDGTFESWNTWKKNFKTYLDKLENEEGDSNEKNISILLNCIGEEGLDIFYFFRNSQKEDYDDLIDAYDKYFLKNTNETYEYFKFNNLLQLKDQPIEDFERELRQQAEFCGFVCGNDDHQISYKDRMILDQLICGLYDKRIRKRLLKLKHLSIEKVVDYCRNVELYYSKVNCLENDIVKKENDWDSENSQNSYVEDLEVFRQIDHHQKNNIDKNNPESNGEKKKPHIKKPLNAFMLYMKEMRAKVVAECTLKESAAINQILGRRWHSLSREEQAKYYEKARQERQLHMQLYPGWSARDNYGYGTKKKKRKKERTPIESGGNSMKKCRARYGLDHQSQWCKPCRRKKKCIRYMESGDGNDGNQSDDNLGSCGSMGDAHTPPDDDGESLNRSMSSPGGLSALSSLTSPGGMILPSPSTSIASPSVSLASPYMLQSPLTPHEQLDVKLPPPLILQQPARNPVGTNPHDINNPLSVNQLTGQCVRNDSSENNSKEATRSIISVT